ncbi:MAG TPA: PEP-CTERM sorting domain-containing protein [Methyloversatilis sp.]
MQKLFTSLLILAAALLANPASAGSIQSLAGLEKIRVYEITSSTQFADFALSDTRLTTRLAGSALTAASRDFGFFAGDENYDLFFSNADGTLNANGSYLTIEGNCGVPYNCFNINAVALVKTGGVLEFADTLSGAVYGRPGSYTPGSALAAVDGSLNTFTRMGDTIGMGADARMRITVGFASTPPVPEPESWALMLAGLGLTVAMVRRREAA